MKLRILSLAAISAISFVAFSGLSYAEQPQDAAVTNKSEKSTTQASSSALPTETDRISYAIGADIGHNFKREGVTLSPEMMSQGLKDAMSGGKMLLDAKEIQITLVNFQKELMTKHQAKIQEAGAKNKTDSEAFLSENKGKPGVVTLPDGLQYKIIKPGTGASPTDKDTVTVNYEGTLPNGQVFDSSYSRGKPFTFQVSEVIPGWTEALKMMKPGAEWMVYIPASLGYGERGAGPIGPNQALIFKVELIAIQPPQNTSDTAAATAAATTKQDSKK